jgi:gluconokinase
MIIVLMGVTGAGKTTIGRVLSEALGWTFYDADDFHSQSNIEKMRSGQPLTDEDRVAWLESLEKLIRDSIRSKSNIVLACSALKASYRLHLLIDAQVRLVYLKGARSLIQERVAERRGHYMNPSLIESQFAILDEPEHALILDAAGLPEDIVATIREKLRIWPAAERDETSIQVIPTTE